MSNLCNLCPRKCNINRTTSNGYCQVSGEGIKLARAALHFWEEPCLSGENGSGTVFFSGCNLRCVYCQNYNISSGDVAKEVSITRLSEIFFELKQRGAHNINLVTPTHYADKIIKAIKLSKDNGFDLPFVYNTSGYESVDTLKMLSGYIDIYLTDFKYWESTTSYEYSNAKDYPLVAKNALKEMLTQIPNCEFDSHGIMTKGVIVRHLLLPDLVDEAKKIVEYIYSEYGDSVFFSLMSQYTPLENVASHEKLNRKVTDTEYDELIDFAIELGIENAFVQEGDSAEESFIPKFDFEGV